MAEIVNFPEFQRIYVVVENEIVSAENCEVIEYSRELDMKYGSVNRHVIFRTKTNKIIRIDSSRFLSFYDLNCGGISFKVTALNFSGEIKIGTEYNASLLSREGCYMYEEKVKHFNTIKINDQFEDNFYSRVKLRDNGEFIDFATFLTCEGVQIKNRSRRIFGENARELITLDAIQNIEIDVYKYFVVEDSRAINKDLLRDICINKLERMKSNGFDEELKRSIEILKIKWDKSNVIINGDNESDLALRFNIYNLMILGNENTSSFAIGAKGLSTEHYGGHYFWDTEAYLLPFYINTAPAIAKNLLKFRYNTLNKAKERAKEQGFEGCLWPWQSDSDGEEGIRQTVLKNGVVIRRDILDQYHIISDVAYACLKYLYKTKDEYFFRKYLSPIIVEGMRFWKSFILKNNEENILKYEIKNVMGPDEYHSKVNNNYYTNYLTRFIFKAFLSIMKKQMKSRSMI